MPHPCWILQKNLTKPDTLAAIKATLEADGVVYEEVMVVPFSEEVPEILHEGEGLVFYGSTTLMLNAYADPRFRQGIFYDPRAFCMENYLRHWGHMMLNHDGRSTSFAKLALEDHPSEMEFFIRPDADTKAFAGQVMTFAEIQTFARGLIDSQHPHLNLDTPISVSIPKIIEKEWRSFVVDGQVISTTRYLHYGELEIDPKDLPDELLSFVASAVAQYQPHPVFVIDTAYCDGQYGILECNCFNGTGYYAHNISKIIRAVNEWIVNKKE